MLCNLQIFQVVFLSLRAQNSRTTPRRISCSVSKNFFGITCFFFCKMLILELFCPFPLSPLPFPSPLPLSLSRAHDKSHRFLSIRSSNQNWPLEMVKVCWNCFKKITSETTQSKEETGWKRITRKNACERKDWQVQKRKREIGSLC